MVVWSVGIETQIKIVEVSFLMAAINPLNILVVLQPGLGTPD